jgi:hypothetical protein
MFASKSVVEHLARGLVGLGALGGSVFYAASYPWLSLLAIPVALVALRGCPMCWTIGLVQTLVARAQGKALDDACVDGTCAAPRVIDRGAPPVQTSR